ncbi:MAG: (E)-4-hydroxy-3-methylbut-2-enyl-diphosphate synthase [Candidatus Delongbacteria bacterium]
MYLPNRLRPRRLITREVRVGELGIGAQHPIRVQSMTTTPTQDVAATVAQTLRLAQAGCELVRITAPTVADAQALGEIRRELKRQNCRVPLCADIHFSPRAALEAARHVEKIRINPGNFSGRPGREERTGTEAAFEEREFEQGRQEARKAFLPLLRLLKQEGRALRIGVNHGSLSQRMVYRHGDTTAGMVESALEYLDFCREENFHDVILSMKASNVRVMIYAYRELVEQLRERELSYPLHLGVTEAGGGIEGILKSAQGIGALLEDGLGDTIRVSLTDPPEMEIAPARALAERYSRPLPDSRLDFPECGHDWLSWSPRPTHLTGDRGSRFRTGGGAVFPVTLSEAAQDVPGLSPLLAQLPDADSYLPRTPGEAAPACRRAGGRPVTLYRSDVVESNVVRRIIPVEVIQDDVSSWAPVVQDVDEILQFHITTRQLPQIHSLVRYIHEHFPAGRTVLSIESEFPVTAYRLLDLALRKLGSRLPLDFFAGREQCKDPLALAAILGSLLADGLIHSLTLEGDVAMTGSRLFAFTVLQGAGARLFATEYVSCPGCGRTLFELDGTTARIQAATSHLKGLKIAVMGCIVNGPGEMADADFGYVGSAPGKIDLYVGRDVVQKNVPQAEAVDQLVALIREQGRWVEP